MKTLALLAVILAACGERPIEHPAPAICGGINQPCCAEYSCATGSICYDVSPDGGADEYKCYRPGMLPPNQPTAP